MSKLLSSKILQITNVSKDLEKMGKLIYCEWECKLEQSLWKTLWEFFRKLERELPYDTAISLLDIRPEKK